MLRLVSMSQGEFDVYLETAVAEYAQAHAKARLRRGYGEEILWRYEEFAKELGISRSSLNVFGFNVAARKLDEKMGYQITSIAMTKEW